MMATGCGADKKIEKENESKTVNEGGKEDTKEDVKDENNNEGKDNSELSNYTELNDLKEEKRTPFIKNLFAGLIKK